MALASWLVRVMLEPGRHAHRAGRLCGPRLNDQEVAAQAGDRALHLLLHAKAEGDHGNDGADADDDAQHGEDGAELVGLEPFVRYQDAFPEHYATPGLVSSLMTSPSRIWMTRRA